MSRSGYTDDCDNLALYRGTVLSSVKGKRGQKLLRELAEGMDAMPEKVLIANELVHDGAYCALGVVGAKRGIDMTGIDPEDAGKVSATFDIAECLAQEIVYINDECGDDFKQQVVGGRWMRVPETPAERWTRVRKWVAKHIKDAPIDTTVTKP